MYRRGSPKNKALPYIIQRDLKARLQSHMSRIGRQQASSISETSAALEPGNEQEAGDAEQLQQANGCMLSTCAILPIRRLLIGSTTRIPDTALYTSLQQHRTAWQPNPSSARSPGRSRNNLSWSPNPADLSLHAL